MDAKILSARGLQNEFKRHHISNSMIRKIPQKNDNILAYEACGMLTDGENRQAIREIQEAITEHGKIRLFIRVPDTPAINTAVTDNRLQFAWNHIDDIEKYALIGNNKVLEWIHRQNRGNDTLEFKSFHVGEESLAWSWLLK